MTGTLEHFLYICIILFFLFQNKWPEVQLGSLCFCFSLYLEIQNKTTRTNIISLKVFVFRFSVNIRHAFIKKKQIKQYSETFKSTLSVNSRFICNMSFLLLCINIIYTCIYFIKHILFQRLQQFINNYNSYGGPKPMSPYATSTYDAIWAVAWTLRDVLDQYDRYIFSICMSLGWSWW